MNNIASIVLGLTAWVLPLLFLAVRHHRNLLCGGSLVCCALSLYFQIREVYRLVEKEDFSAIMDTIGAVHFCAAVLVAVTLVLIVLVQRKKT